MLVLGGQLQEGRRRDVKLILSAYCACNHDSIRFGCEMEDFQNMQKAARVFQQRKARAAYVARHGGPVEDMYFSVHWRGKHVLAVQET